MNKLISFVFLLLVVTCTYGQKAGAEIELSSSDLGISLQDAIIKFTIDTLKADVISEPPGVARGIKAELPDSTIIYLQVKRKDVVGTFSYSFKDLLEEKVIGVGLAYTNCKKKKIGSGFVWWGLNNPYCRPLP